MLRETQVAVRAAQAAGRIAMRQFSRAHRVRLKALGELVTETDLQAERAILRILQGAFPRYAVLSEESGWHAGEDRTWIVDPLDGTTNFSIRNPFFGVSVALLRGGDVVSGVVLAPATGELFVAERGRGAFLNGKRIRVSSESDLGKLLVTFCNGNDAASIRRIVAIYAAMKPAARDFSRMRAATLELAFVAAGRLAAHLSPGGKPWDNAAGALLVEEAGGKVTDFRGDRWTMKKKDLLATNGVVHEQVRKRITRNT
ncbi:MAG: inositol monophosphatase [Candidatus Aenigmarchaeota archaeon]|nr:inositol monophosphatase [Candidatus Aenigmarchaeota archaeon]